MEKMQTQEIISAMADGQLRGGAFARGMELAAGDPAALEAWHAYHLIGDVLRSSELAAGTLPDVFLGRLRSRLQQEQPLAMPMTGDAPQTPWLPAVPQ
jgi:sigma-E factor negative regulatory protein RseA